MGERRGESIESFEFLKNGSIWEKRSTRNISNWRPMETSGSYDFRKYVRFFIANPRGGTSLFRVEL